MRHTMALGAKPSVRRPREQAILMVFLTALVTVLCSRTVAAEDKTLSISVLQFGTAHWELDHIRHAGLDEANGYQLELRPVANLPASRLAVTSGSVNGAVADLLWVQSRYTSGSAYFYVPFSSQIGDVVVASESDIRSVADLVGRRVGVAGGPDSKGWILLTEVARDQGLALADSVELQFGAPPLLSQALKRGQVDAIVTYWHFAARLKGQGAGARPSAWRTCWGVWAWIPACRCWATCSRKPGRTSIFRWFADLPGPSARPNSSWRQTPSTGTG